MTPAAISFDDVSKRYGENAAPVLDPTGSLMAVLDIDSAKPGTFDKEDGDALERIVLRFARQ